jgi:exosortase C (VPDSG-CTERM-specific)
VSDGSITEKATSSALPNPDIAVNGGQPMRLALRRFAWWALLLAVLFCVPLFQLASLALQDDLYSHVPLMPFVSVYMAWLIRHRLPATASQSRAWAAVPASAGLLALLAYGLFLLQGTPLPLNDRLALSIGAFVCCLVSAAILCLGWSTIRVLACPAVLLLFLIPFPTAVKNGLEVFLQHSSAEAAYWLFQLANVPVHRDGVTFALPGITITVAEECSGIRSSFVLFVTGLIGGGMFLANPWHRFWFSLVTIPLGIVRNGLRVLTLGLLCVHVDPAMIHSVIHRRGGPVFFALSLIPLFGFLILLRRREQRNQARAAESGRPTVQPRMDTDGPSVAKPQPNPNKP